MRSDERGFSLLEVILALGMLAAVLVSTTGLLVMGSYQTKSGRTASEALSVARTILEEMQGWGLSTDLPRLRAQRLGRQLYD